MNTKMFSLRLETEMIESDLTAAERLKSYLEASELARMNAETAREMAAGWPEESAEYLRSAADADARREHYLRWAREMEVIAISRLGDE
jgi:hypothetical protein